jgi:hypothetical protein
MMLSQPFDRDIRRMNVLAEPATDSTDTSSGLKEVVVTLPSALTGTETSPL